jgi:peroxiredoxin (alkyl hydroperoxide reductase subunit C)
MEEMHALPVIGENAPEFECVTTHGPMKLSDQIGRAHV